MSLNPSWYQCFLQVGGKQLVQRLPNFAEAPHTLTQTRQLRQSGVGAAAAVEQAINFVHGFAQGTQSRQPARDARLQRAPFAGR